MPKQKITKDLERIKHSVIHPAVERVGAVVLTVISVLVTFEAIVEHHAKPSGHRDHDRPAISEILARGEAKGETARLPEEFDIGLQTPHVCGI